MPTPRLDPITVRRYFVLSASLLFMVIGTGSIYFLVVALKLISAEFDWPRVIPSIAYSLQYFGAGIGGIFMGYCLDRFRHGDSGLGRCDHDWLWRYSDNLYFERMAAILHLRHHDGLLGPVGVILAADRQYHPMV